MIIGLHIPLAAQSSSTGAPAANPEQAADATQGEIVVPPAPPRDRRPGTTGSSADVSQRAPVSGRVPAKFSLPAGAPLPVRTTRELNAQHAYSGQTFEAILDDDVVANDQVVLPKGTVFRGTLSDVAPGGRVSGRSQMTLTLDSILREDFEYPIRTDPILVQAQGSKTRDARTIGIAAGIGAALGAILGGKKGAAVGAAIGGGAGTARVLTTRGQEARIEKEQLLTFSLSEPFDNEEARGNPGPSRSKP